MKNSARRPLSQALPLLLLTPLLFFIPVTHDEIWHIWIGRQILHGARLYRDIIEINPPLWFWMGVPLAGVGDEFQIRAANVVIGFYACAIALCLFLSPSRYRLLIAATVVLVPLFDFGQREHYALVATIPYAFLIASRMNGQSPRHPLAIGLFAATGLALKPHFVLVPIALELLVWRDRRVRSETAVLALAAISYATAVFMFTPEYLTTIVPMAYRAYGAFIGGLSIQWVVLALLLGGIGLWLGRRKLSAESASLCVAGLAFVPAILLQAKGWSYQTIPARGFIFLAIGIELLNARKNPLTDALLVGAAICCLQPIGVHKNWFRDEVEQHLQGVPAGTSVFVFSSNPAVAWPLVEERKLKWSSRQFSMWQLPATKHDPELRAELRRIVAEDLSRKPTLVLVYRQPIIGIRAEEFAPADFHQRYRLRKRTSRFDSYVRASAS